MELNTLFSNVLIAIYNALARTMRKSDRAYPVQNDWGDSTRFDAAANNALKRNIFLVCLWFILATTLLILQPKIVQADENNDVIKVYLKNHNQFGDDAPSLDAPPIPNRFCWVGYGGAEPIYTAVSDANGLCLFKLPKGYVNQSVRISVHGFCPPDVPSLLCSGTYRYPQNAPGVDVFIDENRNGTGFIYTYDPGWGEAVPEFSLMTGASALISSTTAYLMLKRKR